MQNFQIVMIRLVCFESERAKIVTLLLKNLTFEYLLRTIPMVFFQYSPLLQRRFVGKSTERISRPRSPTKQMTGSESAVVERSLPNPRVVSSNPGRGTSSSPSWDWVDLMKVQVAEKGNGHPTPFAEA